jgi:ankyrin repeat protein
MDVSVLCFDELLRFLDSKQDECIVSCLELTRTAEANLNVLKVFSEAFNFREEVKKPKKKKSKNAPAEEEEVPQEDPLFDAIRRASLKAMYAIVRTLHSAPETLKDLQRAVANVPEFLTQVCSALTWLKKDLSSEKVDQKVKAVQDSIYALMILVFVLRHNADSAIEFCKSDVLGILPELASEKKLTLYCIQILDILSTFKQGIAVLNTPPMQALMMTLLGNAGRALSEPAEDAPPANAKDKGKKEAPKKGAVVEAVEDPMDKLDFIAVTPQRSAVASIKLLCRAYTAIAAQMNASLELETARSFSALVSAAILSPVAHEVSRSPHQAPLDESLTDSIDAMCIALGTFGLVSADVRCATSGAGALSSVLTVLLNSRTIIAGAAPPPAPTGGKGAPVVEAPPPLSPEEQTRQQLRLVQLRRVAEKAVLNLVTESLESPLDDALAGHVSHGIHLPVRWTSCFARKSDDSSFDAGDATLAAKLVDLLSATNDEDLSNRGVRVLAAVLHGHHHPVELIESKALHKTLIKPLSQIVQARGLSLVASEVQRDIRDAAAARLLALTVAQPPAEADAEVEEVTAAVAAAALEPVATSDPAAVPAAAVVESAPAADVLIPSVAETFFLALSVVELFLLTNAETINAFTTSGRVEVLADLLRVLGPVSNADSTRPSCGIPEKRAEFEAVLHDPRRHNWSSLKPSSYCDHAMVRPLIFDVLALTAAAGQKYRVYEGQLPAPPCEPVPPAQSPCEETSLITCKYAADACCATLLSQSDLVWTETTSGAYLNVRPSNSRKLTPAVQDAALSLLQSIGTCGVRGVAGAVAAIASSGFSFAAANMPDIDVANPAGVNAADTAKKVVQGRCAMRDLLTVIRASSGVDAADGNFAALVPAGFSWKRPAFFDEVFPENDVLTQTATLSQQPQLWPFVVFCGAFIGTLANPNTSPSAAAVTLDALSSAVRLHVLEDHSQPVITDAVAAVFLCLGGGVALTGLLGRFGTLSADVKPAGMQLAYYLFNRGHRREAFWTEWEVAHREEVVLDPKTGKPIVKKDEKKGKDPKAEKKKDPKAPAEVPSAVPDVELNLESTEAYPDPNHGPSRVLWVKLLDVFADDVHEHTPASTALISAVQGTLSELAVYLIDQGAGVDHRDGANRTALMYALLLSDKAAVASLSARRADFNLLDGEGNPTVKYAVLSLSADDVERVLFGHLHDVVAPPIDLFGRPALLHDLLNTSMDFNVCGPRGHSPILAALGLGRLIVQVGGYTLHVVNASYNSPSATLEQVHHDVEALIADGALVNFCDRLGVVALHIAAAHGDAKLMEILLKNGAVPTAVDQAGFLPLHYLAACCPENAVACFDLLLRHSSHRPLERSVFNDYRTGVSQEEKDAIELEMHLASAFSEALSPSIIRKRRLSPSEILHQCTDGNLNLLKLCFSAPVLLADNPQLQPFLTADKDRRMTLALHIIQTTEAANNKDARAVLAHTDPATNFTTLHAAALLFQGMTPQIYLTEREKKAKRVRKFVSNEARLLDYISSCVDSSVFNLACTLPLPALGIDKWTLMHPAVFWDNAEVASWLLQKGFRVEETEIVHFLAEKVPNASEALVRIVMEAAVASPKSRSLLNDVGTVHSPARPLHLAVRARNLNLVRALATCVKVDLNAVDDLSGKTALHEACEVGALNLVQAFIPGADRLDLFAGNSNQSEAGRPVRTPLNVALDTSDVHLLHELVFMRKNDVIQQLLQISAQSNTHGGSDGETAQAATTLLYALEKQNAELAQRLGLNVPPVPLPSGVSSPQKQSDATAGSKRYSQKGEGRAGESFSDGEEGAVEGIAVQQGQPGAVDGADVEGEPSEQAPEAPPVVESALEDLDVIEQSGIGGKAQQDRKRSLALFAKGNEVLRTVIELVNGSGIVGEGDHYHPYYYAGKLVQTD